MPNSVQICSNLWPCIRNKETHTYRFKLYIYKTQHCRGVTCKFCTSSTVNTFLIGTSKTDIMDPFTNTRNKSRKVNSGFQPYHSLYPSTAGNRNRKRTVTIMWQRFTQTCLHINLLVTEKHVWRNQINCKRKVLP